ncbi:glycoside hydrolase family 9 protein [Aquimarina megaterium]|uniref:glycoside hydrolase family 9 protein n=1 Tax=Aquimarina megaterium TaxID=1443666 RepID=UPI00046F78B0|nr:glycoside hydrolase family 9 protein [Aquimarina megaterium]
MKKYLYLILIFLFKIVSAQTIVDVHTANTNVIVVVLEMSVENQDVIPSTSGWTVNGTIPVSIGRGAGVYDERKYDWTVGYYEIFVRHNIYLELNQNLVNNTNYTIISPYGTTSLAFSDTEVFCESIKVNQEGYSGNATGNYANFGYYGGNLGSTMFDVIPDYQVINENNTVITSGKLIYWGDDTDIGLATSGEHVYRIDLSNVPVGGPYHIVVNGVGRSYSFGVGNNYLRKIAEVHARGMFHQRCGIELKRPYTEYEREICHEESAFTMDTWSSSSFIDVPNDAEMHAVIGGYHDAGDFDRRPYHTVIPITMLSTFEAFPQNFIDRQYNIPESGNGIPDFLDEALWGVLIWENLQLNQDNWDNPDDFGGVMQGTETMAHPTYGAHRADYEDDRQYGTFEVGIKTTLEAAGMFAQASRIIEPYDSDRASDLFAKAEQAWSYIDRNYVSGTHRGAMLYAALQMYLVTAIGNDTEDAQNRYHTLFREEVLNTIINGGTWPDQYLGGNMSATIKSSQFISYLLVSDIYTDPTISEGLLNALKFQADTGGYMGWNENDFPYAQGVTKYNGWGASTAQGRYTEDLGYMMRLSTSEEDKQHYYNQISNYANYSLGLNPQGHSYVTGLGDKQPISPAHLDSYYTKYGELPGGGAQPVIGNVPGIVIYGSTEGRSGQPYQRVITDKLYPAWDDLPGLRRWSDGWSLINGNEFTTWETMVWNVCMFGILYDASIDEIEVVVEEEVDDMEESNNEFLIYPNPSENTININYSELEGTRVEIIDMIGKRIYREVASQNEHFIRHSFAKGVYFLTVSKKGETLVKKFIVQ